MLPLKEESICYRCRFVAVQTLYNSTSGIEFDDDGFPWVGPGIIVAGVSEGRPATGWVYGYASYDVLGHVSLSA